MLHEETEAQPLANRKPHRVGYTGYKHNSNLKYMYKQCQEVHAAQHLKLNPIALLEIDIGNIMK